MNHKQICFFLDTPPKQKIKLGLERIKKLLVFLGNPQKKYPAVIIGGTNGKGSVVAMLASILTEAGYKVGWYTSPHILSYRERFRIGRRMITEKDFVRIFNKIKEHSLVEKPAGKILHHLTTFEILTVMAFDWFAQEKIDIALLEVGLGGRLDATNVAAPLLSLITNVELDHREYLGNTLAQIAREKAGIIKPKTPVITAARRPAAVAAIKKIALTKKSPLLNIYQKNYFHLDFISIGQKYRTPLLGEFQSENKALALAAVYLLRKRGWLIPARAVKDGLAKVTWPGRLEIVSRKPLTIFDVAHNPAAAAALRQSLVHLWPGKKWFFVLGILRRKNAQGIIKELAPKAAKFFFAPLNEPAFSPQELSRFARLYRRPAREFKTVAAALRQAQAEAGLATGGERPAACLTGSFLTVAAGAKFLRHMKKNE